MCVEKLDQQRDNKAAAAAEAVYVWHENIHFEQVG